MGAKISEGGHSPDPRFRPAIHALGRSGPLGSEISAYIGERRLRLAFIRQRNSGARWFDWRRLRFGVFLNAEYLAARPDAPFISALIAHEVKHLQQGWAEALSVRGELVAWQVQYDVLSGLSAAPRDPRWGQIRKLDPASRVDLRIARGLMKAVGGPGYHIELLPLWPACKEAPYCAGRLLRRLCPAVRS